MEYSLGLFLAGSLISFIIGFIMGAKDRFDAVLVGYKKGLKEGTEKTLEYVEKAILEKTKGKENTNEQ